MTFHGRDLIIVLFNKSVLDDGDELVKKLNDASVLQTSDFDKAMCELSEFFLDKKKKNSSSTRWKTNWILQIDPSAK